ncbi:hypothetical protein [Sphingobacterium sp. HSC-15S19]|uniref:hypothetical protein n=1 Tax=Sphingobacterium TaxID=28453 RepID=UPI003D2112EF
MTGNLTSNLIAVALFLLALPSFSQTQPLKKQLPDSLRQKAVAFMANKFADARPLNIEFTVQLPTDYTVNSQKGNSLPDGKITNFNQLKTNLNYNFIRKRKWMLGASVEYRYYSITNETSTEQQPTVTNSLKSNFSYHSSSINFTYFSRLFGKTMIYGVNGIVDGSEKGFERTRGLVFGSMILKADQRTKIIVGAMANVGPNAQIPVLPMFTYERKFGKDMVMDILLPRQILLRKYFPHRSRLSIGAEMDQTNFFLYDIKSFDSSKIYEWQQASSNTGLIYEHILGKYFIATFRTGAKIPLSGRLYEKNKVRDPLFKISAAPSFYFNIGISFNPFMPLKRK